MNYFSPQIIYGDTLWQWFVLISITIFLENIKLRTSTWSKLQVPNPRRNFHLPITQIGHHKGINQVGCTFSTKNQLKASRRIVIFLRTMTWCKDGLLIHMTNMVILTSWLAQKLHKRRKYSLCLRKPNYTSKNKSFKFKYCLQCLRITNVLKQNIIQVMAVTNYNGIRKRRGKNTKFEINRYKLWLNEINRSTICTEQRK